jgi:hypothetical protein
MGVAWQTSPGPAGPDCQFDSSAAKVQPARRTASNCTAKTKKLTTRPRRPAKVQARPKARRKPLSAARRVGRRKRPLTPTMLADDIPDKVPAEYRQLLSQGVADKQATQQLVRNWKKLLSTKALQDEFWLALAAAQWQLGRLEPPIKKQALAIIDRFVKPPRQRKARESDVAAHRREALTALRGILTSPQPAKKEIRASKAPSSDAEAWPVGEVFAYKLLSGRYVLFHVVACLGDKASGFWPVFALLDWIDSDYPRKGVQQLPLKTDPYSTSEAVWMVSVVKRHPSDFSPERIDWLNVRREPHAPNIDRGFAITYWKEKLDEKLRFDFGWE